MLWLPATLFGPFVGNWIDGLPRKYVFFAASFTRAISFLIFATILAFSPHIYWCYTMSAINGFLYTIISPSSFAMVKEIVSRNQLTAANSTMDMVFEIGNIGGMGIAGILLQFLGITDLFYVVGAFIFIGTFFILAIKIKKETNYTIPIKLLFLKTLPKPLVI